MLFYVYDGTKKEFIKNFLLWFRSNLSYLFLLVRNNCCIVESFFLVQPPNSEIFNAIKNFNECWSISFHQPTWLIWEISSSIELHNWLNFASRFNANRSVTLILSSSWSVVRLSVSTRTRSTHHSIFRIHWHFLLECSLTRFDIIWKIENFTF